MGKKYIIELPENTHWIQWLMEGAEDHHPYMDFKQVEDLTPYTEPDLEQVRKKAYEEGYHAGYGRYINKSFEDGVKGSWEAARKIICEMDDEDLMKIFGGNNLDYIFALSPTTVIEKLKAYEQEQEEIKVGDEVERILDGEVDSKAVFLEENKGYYHCLFWTGSFFTTLSYPKKQFRKTGRHFPEIAAVLEKMRGEQE